MIKAAHNHQLLFSNTLPINPFNIPLNCSAEGTATGGAGGGGNEGAGSGGGVFLDFE